MAAEKSQHIVVGRVTGHFGVKGWVKVQSWTEPREKIIEYRPWFLARGGGAWRACQPEASRVHGKSVVARFQGIGDREQAAILLGSTIAVRRDQLPVIGPGEYYWADLVGLDVRLIDGRSLGRVQRLLATGSNDVMVVDAERERLIPFIRGQVVKDVDLDQRVIQVDWDPDF